MTMPAKNRPIGVIDSGIGGFSVAKKVQERLPHEDILYLGDGANTPYGNHSAEEILEMTRYMLRFMESHQVKALLVACNTISCLIDQFRDEMSCPVYSVVQSGAEAAVGQPFDQVGVISTCFTASTHCYPDMIARLDPNLRVISHGCPDLANLVERNVGDPSARALIDADLIRNLDPLVKDQGIRCCVLGCTHYPLVADNIRQLYPDLVLVDPAEQMAKTVRQNLYLCQLLNPQIKPGRLDIFTTGSLEEYIQKANKVGLSNICSVQYHPAMQITDQPAM